MEYAQINLGFLVLLNGFGCCRACVHQLFKAECCYGILCIFLTESIHRLFKLLVVQVCTMAKPWVNHGTNHVLLAHDHTVFFNVRLKLFGAPAALALHRVGNVWINILVMFSKRNCY